MTRPEVKRDAIMRLRQADRMERWQLAAALQARADERRPAPQSDERPTPWRIAGLTVFFLVMLVVIAYGVPILGTLVQP